MTFILDLYLQVMTPWVFKCAIISLALVTTCLSD